MLALEWSVVGQLVLPATTTIWFASTIIVFCNNHTRQAVLLGFVLGAKVTLDLLDPAGGGKPPDFEVTDDDVKVCARACSFWEWAGNELHSYLPSFF